MNTATRPPIGTMITALIVDDERPARARIRQLLLTHRTVVVTGEAGDVDDAGGTARPVDRSPQPAAVEA